MIQYISTSINEANGFLSNELIHDLVNFIIKNNNQVYK